MPSPVSGRQTIRFLRTSYPIRVAEYKITIYYDCGQAAISKILRNTFGKIFRSRMDFRTAYQKDYKLLQVADYICTLEQPKGRWDNDNPTKSEKVFFLSRQKFLQNYYRKISKKHI